MALLHLQEKKMQELSKDFGDSFKVLDSSLSPV
jgi:hypothetical protein